MSDTVTNATSNTPVHLWIVGVLATVWNAFGCFDYVMTQTNNADYMAMFTEAQRAYFESFPAWMEGAWAVGVWGALLGSLLLLIRSKFAVTAYGLSLLGLLVGTVYQYGMSEMPAEMRAPLMLGISALIWVIAIFLLWYAVRMRQRGVLR